ncbi:MAG: prepilin-type N-terminal cleavage/methylation domain-containing protein [Candidatus Hydrogenedentota bacterium]|nr:MAG: prepilin-type N-terminal cleavage/methylation domain-containing protein [Candidatus Hydrogenedentota bacterium]
MHKGFSLVEVLVVVIVLPFAFVMLDGLFTTLLAEIPRSYYITQESTTLQNLLEQMQQDMDKSRGLPESFAGQKADDKQILIELRDSVICYQQKDDQIIRRRLKDALQEGEIEEKRVWPLPHTKVEWKIREMDSKGHAVEVRTHIEYKTRGRLKKTRANSHLYYGGVIR